MKRIWNFGGALLWGALGVAACDVGEAGGGAPFETDAGPDSGTGGDASLPLEAGLDSASDTTPGADATASNEAGADVATADGASMDGPTPVDATTADVIADGATTDGTTADGATTDDATGDAGESGDSPADARGAGTPTYALFVGTDFLNAELSVVRLAPDSVAGRLPVADQDSVPFASGGLGFVLEHAEGKVVLLDSREPWMATGTIDINDTPGAKAYASNPRTVLVSTGTKAYVARYASNVVKIVDVAAGTVTGSVDLSAFLAPDDPDGLVDVQDGAYDPVSQRAYFLLERINQFDFSGSAPDYVAACLASHGEIVAVDVTTDAIVDLNGAAPGQAIDLLGANPASLTPDFGNGKIIVPETGCYEIADSGADAATTLRIGRGIESVDLVTATPTWLYQTSAEERLYGVIWVDETHAFVNLGSAWFAWNPAQTVLGDVIADFPQAPFYDGVGRVIGLSAAAPAVGEDGGTLWSVVALDVATTALSTIGANPFQSVVPATSLGGVASAFLH